jgi:hypothetical protein
MTTEEQKPVPETADDHYLCSVKETAARLGYSYRTFLQARTKGLVLLEEVRPSDSEGGHPKYRLSDIKRVQRGEIKALKAFEFPAEERQRAHARGAELRAARKAARHA